MPTSLSLIWPIWPSSAAPTPHAKINSIDTSAAEALDGVIAVYTGEALLADDIGPLPSGWNPPGIKVPVQNALTVDKVRHVGDRVAIVVAESPYIAADAIDLIDVDYTPLDAVVDARKAMEPGAPLVHDEIENNVSYTWALGNKEAMDTAFAEADHVVELELLNQRLIATAMEPRAAIAQWNNFTEEMTLWTTSQNPNLIRIVLSAFTLKIPEHKLRLISPDVGGGFGSKIPHYPEEILVPWAARKLNRPIKWVATRSESIQSDTQGRDHVTVCKLALKNDGSITGIHVKTWANNGAYISLVAALIPTAFYITMLSGLYKFEGVYGEMWGTLSNTVWVDAYRGAGRPEAAYVVERLVDVAARELNIDPVEIRRKNFIPVEDFPYQTPVALQYDSGDYHAVMDEAVKVANYAKMRADQKEAQGDGRLVGVGVSACIEASGPVPSKVSGALGGVTGFWESGTIRVHATGKISALTGAHSHGQGHETTFVQIVADELGVPPEDIDLIHGDTAVITNAMGTYGSRSTKRGCQRLGASSTQSPREAKTHRRPSARSRCGRCCLRFSFRPSSCGRVTRQSDELRRTCLLQPTRPTIYPTAWNLVLKKIAITIRLTLPIQTSIHIAQVELDKDTGEISIQRYVAVDDVGNIINPMIVRGQVVGGVAQGVGQALWEHGVYDDGGQLVSGSLLDYAVPRADNFPMMETSHTETPSPHNPLGVKGVGEMGTIASTPAVVNAVMDALAPLGVKHIDMPLTAQKVHAAIAAANGGGN